jgi:hypothetical protein
LHALGTDRAESSSWCGWGGNRKIEDICGCQWACRTQTRNYSLLPLIGTIYVPRTFFQFPCVFDLFFDICNFCYHRYPLSRRKINSNNNTMPRDLNQLRLTKIAIPHDILGLFCDIFIGRTIHNLWHWLSKSMMMTQQ